MRAEPRESSVSTVAGPPSSADGGPERATRASELRTREQEEFLTGGMVPLACASCASRVLVKKNSPQHTSIQWLSDAGSSCPVLAAEVAKGTHPALLDTCERLQDTIADAARKGTFEQ